MILEPLFKRFKKDNFNLGMGLVVGLFCGGVLFAMGLSENLLEGLLIGGVLSFLIGFASLVLAAGVGSNGGGILGYFISFTLCFALLCLFLYFPSFIPIWLFILIGIIILETCFWLDKQKPKKKQNKLWFTVGKKLEALLESIAILGTLNLIRLLIKWIISWKIPWETIITWIGYIGIGLAALFVTGLVLYLYIKLNSLKYKKKK